MRSQKYEWDQQKEDSSDSKALGDLIWNETFPNI